MRVEMWVYTHETARVRCALHAQGVLLRYLECSSSVCFFAHLVSREVLSLNIKQSLDKHIEQCQL